jgi:hypothetical protein
MDYSLCKLIHSPVTSSLSNILLRTLLSNTLSLCYSLNVRDHISYPYKITRRIRVLYILTFTFLDSRRDDKRMVTSIPLINSALNPFMNTILMLVWFPNI